MGMLQNGDIIRVRSARTMGCTADSASTINVDSTTPGYVSGDTHFHHAADAVSGRVDLFQARGQLRDMRRVFMSK